MRLVLLHSQIQIGSAERVFPEVCSRDSNEVRFGSKTSRFSNIRYRFMNREIRRTFAEGQLLKNRFSPLNLIEPKLYAWKRGMNSTVRLENLIAKNESIRNSN
jgi:hypothetical protein